MWLILLVKMSHFTLLVIGEEDIESALSPFWELDLSQEDLMNDDRAEFIVSFKKEDLETEFKKFKEKYKEDLDKEEKDYWVKYRTCSAEEWLESWNGLYLNKEKTDYGYYTNPNAKWDWYAIGGRWGGMLKLKKSANIDEYEKPNFSWGIKDEEKEKIIKNRMVDSAYKKDITLASLKNIGTFAVLRNGEWFEKGSMGWWGISSETDEESKKWENGYYENFIKNLNEDTLLTIVDLHI